jgi:hypothetical protein
VKLQFINQQADITSLKIPPEIGQFQFNINGRKKIKGHSTYGNNYLPIIVESVDTTEGNCQMLCIEDNRRKSGK